MSDEIMLAGYAFAANKEALACKHVIEGMRPALGFVHEVDGEIEVWCGGRNHLEDDFYFVCLSDLVERHPDLGTLPKVELGTEAWRDGPREAWVVSRL